MITLEKVCFAYEHEVALRYVNLHIEKGESLVIQGPNGCGKSTLIKLLNGIIFPSEGHYLYKDHEITEKALKDRQFAKWFHQQMGYVFQNADTQLFCGSCCCTDTSSASSAAFSGATSNWCTKCSCASAIDMPSFSASYIRCVGRMPVMLPHGG